MKVHFKKSVWTCDKISRNAGRNARTNILLQKHVSRFSHNELQG